jgi:hypothetical protein
MRYAFSTALALSLPFVLATPLAARADDGAGTAQATAAVYKPPMRGAPASRVGGATRGTGEADFVLSVLAPEHTGLTARAQPTLYWFASAPASALVEVTLIADGAEKPVLSKPLKTTSAGVQSLDLAKQGVSLKPDTEYEWSVAVVHDRDQRSKDVISGGTIQRVSPDSAVQARAASAGERQAPMVYAEAGLWYDAIDGLSRLIERSPGDAELRAQRAALLEQVGLPAAAAYDRSAPK